MRRSVLSGDGHGYGQKIAARRDALGLPSAVAVCLLACGSCVAPVRSVRPRVDPNTLSETGFVHYLAATAVVTFDEGARAVLSLVGDAAAGEGITQRRAELRRRGAVREQWGVQADTVLDHGSFAYMLCGVLDVRPSFNDSVAGVTGWGARRAAMQTAVFEGILDYAPAHEPISGAEVASALVRGEAWLDRRGLPPRAVRVKRAVDGYDFRQFYRSPS